MHKKKIKVMKSKKKYFHNCVALFQLQDDLPIPWREV